MNRTVLGPVLIGLGVAVIVVSAIAHLIGLSFSATDAASDTFGGKQVAGIVLGVAVAVTGLVLTLTNRDARP